MSVKAFISSTTSPAKAGKLETQASVRVAGILQRPPAAHLPPHEHHPRWPKRSDVSSLVELVVQNKSEGCRGVNPRS